MLPHFTPVEFSPDLGLYFLRAAIGATFLYHGWSKLSNLSATAKGMGMKVHSILALGAIEILGALMLLVGYSVQLAACVLGVVMIGALYYKVSKWKMPFYTAKGNGYELDIIVLASCIAILLTGGGQIGFVQGLILMVKSGM